MCVAGDAGHAAQFDPVRMSSVDKQRIAAVEILKQLGYSFSCATGWTRPQGDDKSCDSLVVEADALHALLVLRADRLIHDAPSDPAELGIITDAISAYEAIRWARRKE